MPKASKRVVAKEIRVKDEDVLILMLSSTKQRFFGAYSIAERLWGFVSSKHIETVEAALSNLQAKYVFVKTQESRPGCVYIDYVSLFGQYLVLKDRLQDHITSAAPSAEEAPSYEDLLTAAGII